MPALPETECATYLIISKSRQVYSSSGMFEIEYRNELKCSS